MRRAVRLLSAAVITIAATATVAAPADAAPSVRVFANCTAVHAVYSGGIAKKGVTRNTVRSGGTTTYRALKGRVEFSTALYTANSRLDRDRDGIACEKS